MIRRTSVVFGPLASHMRRLKAARADEVGLEVTTISGLAERLAGGFLQAPSDEALLPAIRDALDEGGFLEIDAIRRFPGVPRAIAATLRDVWRADLGLGQRACAPELEGLSRLDGRVRALLPDGVIAPPDLRDAALLRIHHANAVLGPVTLEGVLDVDPVWRPLFVRLADFVPLAWVTAGAVDRSWFPGRLEVVRLGCGTRPAAEACADPRAESVEALRWARGLLARGDVLASDIAIASTTTEAWDEHFLALAREAGIPLHFTHGVPALDTRPGQTCAALADVLLRGLSQTRVRRLLRLVRPAGVPDDWSLGLPRSARLAQPEHWKRALATAGPRRLSGGAADAALPPLLSLLARGPAAAREAGQAVLRGTALRLWRDALDAAPPEALELSLEGLKVADAGHPGSRVTWGPAAHLAAAPRPYVRLIGLAAGGWPRAEDEDPLLPDRNLPRPWSGVPSRPERDAMLFNVIVGAASGGLALSRPRRSAEGGSQSPSRLWPVDSVELERTRVPAHAFGEADRLLARPRDAAADPGLSRARNCWRDWHRPELTAHDGLVPNAHPGLDRALGRTHSAQSMGRLLRDPLAFVLVDALGFAPAVRAAERLTLDPPSFGELAHEILRRAVDALEAGAGLAAADEAYIRAAVGAAAASAAVNWPLERAVPPAMLWRRAVWEASHFAFAGLSAERVRPGTRVWTEVSFGTEDTASAPGQPWNPALPVSVGSLLAKGRIDRLDVKAERDAARVTDYKTGDPPDSRQRTELDGGRELQRVLYAAAVRQMLPDVGDVRSRLLHLPDGSMGELSGPVIDRCIAALGEALATAATNLRSGVAVPGPDSRLRYNRMRLALPADLEGYLGRKGAALGTALAPLYPAWNLP